MLCSPVSQCRLRSIAKSSLDLLELQKIYSDVSVLPDAEHRLISLLIAEGAVSELITTNWDPLIERAYAALGCTPTLMVVACNAEMDPISLRIACFQNSWVC